MCDENYDPPEVLRAAADDPVLAGHRHGAQLSAEHLRTPSDIALPTRRRALQFGAAGALGVVGAASGWFAGVGPARAGVQVKPLSSDRLFRVAMHVHASWSERQASWESQFAQAAALGIDAMYMTEHDWRAEGFGYLPSLQGVTMLATVQGGLAQNATTNTDGLVRTLAESSSTTVAASVSYAVQESPTAVNQLRTSIAGQSLMVDFVGVRIDSTATYDVLVQLSNHPAYGTRPAGQFYLRYRFGDFQSGYGLDASGLIGNVTNPAPAAGSTLTFDLTSDVAQLWPDMVAFDNSFAMLSLVATSPRSGVVVDVSVNVRFMRTQNDSGALTALHRSIIDTYGPRHQALTTYPVTEISWADPHLIPFGVGQFWPDQSLITRDDPDSAYRTIVSDVNADGGIVSWNHPFGADTGPLLSATARTAKRQSVFSSMKKAQCLGAGILEVGYKLRGQVDIQTHFDLWDTFSRWCIFLTGNGANDDHAGMNWQALGNGFTTGIWTASVADSDLVAGLSAGRAFAYHCGLFAGGQLDLLVDGRVPMGHVSVSSAGSRSVAIFAAGLPTGSVVEVVQGRVDYTGTDPGTMIRTHFKAAAFSGSGVVSVQINTASSTFVRVQVRTSDGTLVGTGNPVWLLRAPPPGGIPAARGG